MTTTLSSKGQVVVPKQARVRLHLRPGTKFACKVDRGSLILTPEPASQDLPRLITDPKTGLRITQSPEGPKVTSGEVRAALADFP